MTHNYTAYGLYIESDLPCPELLPVQETADSEQQVHIRYGPVPDSLEDPAGSGVLYQAKPNRFLLKLDNIARYLVSDGRDIVIHREPQATDDEVRLFLLGSALGALLHQRGLLVMHASAMETEHGAVLFAGRSGNGKSTLAAAFRLRGYRLLSDDVCAITQRDGQTLVLPAYPQAKLWTDAAQKLGQETDSLRRVRPQLEKFALPLRDQFCDQPLPLAAVYMLQTHNKEDIELTPVEDARKFGIFLNNTYRGPFLDGLDQRVEHFALAALAANSARVMRAIRPSHPFLLDELAGAIEADLGGS